MRSTITNHAERITSILESCTQVCQRLRSTCSSSTTSQNFVLLKRKWKCLVKSYMFLVDNIYEHVDYLDINQSKDQQVFVDALHAFHHTLERAERLLGSCIYNYDVIDLLHQWLLDSALKFTEISMDILETHLQNALWCYHTCILALHSTNIQTHACHWCTTFFHDLHQIWTLHSPEKDTTSFMEFLEGCLVFFKDCENEFEKKSECQLMVEFFLQKVRNQLESSSNQYNIVLGDSDLPEFFWRDKNEIRFEFNNLLGDGSYAQIFKSKWMDGDFAAKIFSYVQDKTGLGNEAVIQASLCHPNVLNLVCCSWNPDYRRVSIIMDFMDEGDLMLFMIKRNQVPPFSLTESIELMLQIARGMKYLHSLGIIHRDLKSPNILVRNTHNLSTSSLHSNSESNMTFDIQVKITDFGMSKAKLASTKFTTKRVGTREWRAPEVFDIDPIRDQFESSGIYNIDNIRYTNKADVYSFAMVCFEILTGKQPYDAIPSNLLKRKVLSGGRPDLPGECPSVIKEYIQKCWHHDPLQRPNFTHICTTLSYFKTCILLGSINDLKLSELPECIPSDQFASSDGGRRLLIPLQLYPVGLRTITLHVPALNTRLSIVAQSRHEKARITRKASESVLQVEDAEHQMEMQQVNTAISNGDSARSPGSPCNYHPDPLYYYPTVDWLRDNYGFGAKVDANVLSSLSINGESGHDKATIARNVR